MYVDIDSLLEQRRTNFEAVDINFEMESGVPDSLQLYFLNVWRDGRVGYDTQLQGLTSNSIIPTRVNFNAYLWALTPVWTIRKTINDKVKHLHIRTLLNDSVGVTKIGVYPVYNQSK